MKQKIKKIVIIFSIVILICAILLPSIVFSRNMEYTEPYKNYYAELYSDGNDSYILLNDTEKYCYMPFYGFNTSSADIIKIRNGKNPIVSAFKEDFWTYDESEMNFLYNDNSGFLSQTVGWYVKESILDEFFTPTEENIYRVVVTDDDDIDHAEVLSFAPEEEKLFEYFIEKYSDELEDYFFPMQAENNAAIYNERYRIDVEYQSGKITRFLTTVNESEYKKLCSIN